MSLFRLLIVDDQQNVCLGIAQLLEDLPIQIDIANSGEEALSFLQQQSYQLLFLDLGMIGLSGIDVLQEMVKQQYHVPVVVMTAYYQTWSKEALTQLAHPIPLLEVLHKPVDPDYIVTLTEARLRAASE